MYATQPAQATLLALPTCQAWVGHGPCGIDPCTMLQHASFELCCSMPALQCRALAHLCILGGCVEVCSCVPAATHSAAACCLGQVEACRCNGACHGAHVSCAGLLCIADHGATRVVLQYDEPWINTDAIEYVSTPLVVIAVQLLAMQMAC